MNLIQKRKSTNYEMPGVRIAHTIIDYKIKAKQFVTNDSELVRMHFGLKGSYNFHCKKLDWRFALTGHHNNIIYSNGLDVVVENKTKQIETFGINFEPKTFIKIGQYGNDPLKRFTENVMNKRNSILSYEWKTNNLRIQQVVNEIINCDFKDQLKDIFLLSKSIELIVLQADLYSKSSKGNYIKTKIDKEKLIQAKEYVKDHILDPPTIIELAKLVAMNEYKLKRGFKELFGSTVFGYIHQLRMSKAKRLLLGTDKTASEIAFELGYSSPQHFSKAFKKVFGVTPKSIR